jgi:predicted component of type VI protein secretion system
MGALFEASRTGFGRIPIPQGGTRPTVALLAIISVSACTAWQPYMLRSGVEPPTKVRVHLTTGETVTPLLGARHNG